MSIRIAATDDLDAIADLVQDQRIRQQGWEPAFWPLAPNAREVHPLFLRWSIEHGRSVSLVATADDRLCGFAIASPLLGAAVSPVDRGTTWLVEEIGVAAPAMWTNVGRTLLAALAGRVHRQGGARIVAPCPTSDRSRRDAFVAAGLDLNCWFRHARLDEVVAPPETIGADTEPGLPLPHVHGLAHFVAGASSVTAPGAHALVSEPIASPPMFRTGGTTALADPVVADGPTALRQVLGEIEDRCRKRSDVAVIVVVGPGEEPLDLALDERNYARPLEWWAWRPA